MSKTSSSFLNTDMFTETDAGRDSLLLTARYRLEEIRTIGPANANTTATPSLNTAHIPRCIWDRDPLSSSQHIFDGVKTLFYRATHSLSAWNTFTSPQPTNPTSMSIRVFRPIGPESFISVCITRHHDRINTRTTIHAATADLNTALCPSLPTTLGSLLPDLGPGTDISTGTIRHHLALKSKVNDDGPRSWKIEHWSSEMWRPNGEIVRRVKMTEDNAAFRRRVADAAKLVVFVGFRLDELMWDQDDENAQDRGFVKVDLD